VPVTRLALVCVCQKDSPLATLAFVGPGDLQAYNLVAPQMSNSIGVLIAETFAKTATPYTPLVEMRFLNTAARLVQEGWGCALLDELSVSTGRFADLVARPFQPRVNLALSAILPEHRIPSRLTMALADVFQDEAKRLVKGSGASATG